MSWNKYQLSEIINIIGGGTPKTTNHNYWGGEIPWLSVVDFNNDNRYVYETEKTITEEGLKNSSTNILPQGSLILSARGTVGALAQLAKPMAFNQSCYGIIAKKETTNDFLYYLIKHIVGDLQARGHGSVFNTITRDTFETINITLPPLDEQKRIAEILGAFDDKIELLQKQNKTLEEMAKAIFKSWFVDFDIVKAKQKGEKKEDIIKNYHLTEELYNLFPSSFEQSSLGPIPTTWKATTFKTITTQEKTRVGFQELPVLSAVKTGELILSEDFFNKKVFSDNIKNYIIVPPLSFAYNPSRINIGSIGCNHMDFAGCVSPVYVVFSVITGYEKYMEFIIHSSDFNAEVIHRASGTVRQSLSYQDLSYIPLIIPSREIVAMFDKSILSLYEKQILNNQQIQTLTELRDTLLPRLISGKIKV